MQINIGAESGEGENSFFFEAVPNKPLEDKEIKQQFTKWGLSQTLKVGSFRLNQKFNEYDINRLLLDMANSPNVRYVINNIKYPPQSVSNVQFRKLRCTELTMELFDQLESIGVVKGGYIAKMFSDYYEDIEICDRLRQALLMQQSQSYGVFTEDQRQQFLVKLFQLIVIGGSLNQYEDTISPYLQCCKKLYKSLVSVRKRPQDNEIFMQTLVYEIKNIGEGKGFSTTHNPQDVMYVLINPSLRQVHVLANQWHRFW